jgi:hypothetical protein
MEARLTMIASERVRNGTLPASTQFRTFGGRGSGASCAMCGDDVPDSAMEIEVEYRTDTKAEALIMHVACYFAWHRVVGHEERL